MSIKTWKPHPIDLAIVESLERKGALTDIELFDLLRDRYGSVGFGSFNKVLMRLEIEGKVHVSSLIKGKRRVELVKKE
ncbi:hypothetical protein E3I90_04670 [Candidatus Bathyarchaeota archaeon]|nr:MAG: hypothetical protein E3I90_04670 [Candidatus Bathyarchaeota archaeon]